MLERIIIGFAIGFVAGLVLHKEYGNSRNIQNIIMGFIFLIIVAFVGSSFMFGAIYGLMSIGEISVGYWLSNSVLNKK